MAEVTLRQAAAMLGVARQTVYRMAADGRLSVTVRPDPTRPGPDGTPGAGTIKIVDTAELLRVFGRLTPESPPPPAPATVVEPPETPQSGPARTPPATAVDILSPAVVAMTAADRRREYEVADRAALAAELAAARDRLRDLEAQLGEAHDRELRLTELAASATRLLEHREAATVPPPRGWLRRLLGF